MTTIPRTTTARRTAAMKRAPMDSMRKTALVAGIFYLLTFISIPTLIPYGQIKDATLSA
jgi:predicted transporter